MLNIKLSIAQNESDMTSDRIHFVFAQKRARHEICSGKIPFGYSVQDKKLVPNENAKYVQPLFEHFGGCVVTDFTTHTPVSVMY